MENLCVGLSLKYEILHYANDMEAASRVLKELSDIIETNELKELQGKFEALRNNGTMHEKLRAFKEARAAETLNKQMEYDKMVEEMTKLDALDDERKIKIENPDTIDLYPIQHFQFPRKDRKKVYEILNISLVAHTGFDQMWDNDKVIPIANIYNNPITQEGFGDGMVLNNSIEAWRNIYRIRKAFFENGYPRVILKLPQFKVSDQPTFNKK